MNSKKGGFAVIMFAVVGFMAYFFIINGAKDKDKQTPDFAVQFCEENGGRVETRNIEGKTVKYCTFNDGSECETWAFKQKKCQKGEIFAKKEKMMKEVNVDMNIDKWQKLERVRENLKIKYPKTWYYTVNHKEAQKMGYKSIIGFGPSQDIFDMKPHYPVEIIIMSSDKEMGNEFAYSKRLAEINGTKYIATAFDNDSLEKVIEEMANSFSFIKNNLED